MADLSPEEIEALKKSFQEKIDKDDLKAAKEIYKQIRRYNSGSQNYECKMKMSMVFRRTRGPVKGVGPQGFTRPNWIGSRKPVDRVAARVIGRPKKK